MKLEQQVAGLALCRRLKSLGVDQDSLFAWRVESESGRAILHHASYRNYARSDGHEGLAAFTVAELLKAMPPEVDPNRVAVSHHRQHSYACTIYGTDGDIVVTGATAAEACAKTLIHLFEIGLMEAA